MKHHGFSLISYLSALAFLVAMLAFLWLNGLARTPLYAVAASLSAVAVLFLVEKLCRFVDILQTPRVSEMSGAEFEKYCARLLRRNGYKNVRLTRPGADYGVDILAERNGKLTAVQCKHYSSSVGISAVQEAFSGKSFYEADYAAVITNSHFTAAAIKAAGKNGIVLWDGETLNIMAGRHLN